MGEQRLESRSRFLAELTKAEAARDSGNEGMARVCARRAAGIVVGAYFERRGLPESEPSAYARLQRLANMPALPEGVREITRHFLIRITPEHRLPVDADLIAEARWLATTLDAL